MKASPVNWLVVVSEPVKQLFIMFYLHLSPDLRSSSSVDVSAWDSPLLRCLRAATTTLCAAWVVIVMCTRYS